MNNCMNNCINSYTSNNINCIIKRSNVQAFKFSSSRVLECTTQHTQDIDAALKIKFFCTKYLAREMIDQN